MADFQLVESGRETIETLMQWFENATALGQWGGPSARHPFDENTFRQDSRICEIDSYELIGPAGEMLGFGQFYSKLDRVHLSRLCVSPACRGQGMGSRLVELLMARGRDKLGLHNCSLYVLSTNSAAVACYRKAGFVQSAIPAGESHSAGISFMVLDSDEYQTRTGPRAVDQ